MNKRQKILFELFEKKLNSLNEALEDYRTELISLTNNAKFSQSGELIIKCSPDLVSKFQEILSALLQENGARDDDAMRLSKEWAGPTLKKFAEIFIKPRIERANKRRSEEKTIDNSEIRSKPPVIMPSGRAILTKELLYKIQRHVTNEKKRNSAASTKEIVLKYLIDNNIRLTKQDMSRVIDEITI